VRALVAKVIVDLHKEWNISSRDVCVGILKGGVPEPGSKEAAEAAYIDAKMQVKQVLKGIVPVPVTDSQSSRSSTDANSPLNATVAVQRKQEQLLADQPSLKARITMIARLLENQINLKLSNMVWAGHAATMAIIDENGVALVNLPLGYEFLVPGKIYGADPSATDSGTVYAVPTLTQIETDEMKTQKEAERKAEKEKANEEKRKKQEEEQPKKRLKTSIGKVNVMKAVCDMPHVSSLPAWLIGAQRRAHVLRPMTHPATRLCGSF